MKHAFPDQRSGKVMVTYQANGETWTLSVRDDGVGMPPESDNIKAGLGTSIVKALAGQVDSTIDVSDGNPGTLVTLSHKPEDASGPDTTSASAPV